MMNLAPILTGMAVAGLIYQAAAVPVPFKIEAIPPQGGGAPYTTMAAQVGKDMLASLIPYRVLKTQTQPTASGTETPRPFRSGLRKNSQA